MTIKTTSLKVLRTLKLGFLITLFSPWLMLNTQAAVGDSFDVTFPDDNFRDCVMAKAGVVDPDTIITTTHVTSLTMLPCGTKSIIDITGVGTLTALKTAVLHSNQITSIPTEIDQLINIDRLDLYSNQLTSLPAEIGSLTSLTVLQFSKNQLISLPPELANLPKLVRLELYGNQLTSLFPEISNLTTLTMLSLYDNQLTSLPTEITQLTNLTYLPFDNNLLEENSSVTTGSTTFTTPASQQLNTVANSEQTFTGLASLNFDGEMTAAEIGYPLTVTGAIPLSPAHRFYFEDVRDENGNSAVLSDYVDVNNNIIQSGRLSAQIRAKATDTLNIGIESLTPERVLLNFVLPAPPSITPLPTTSLPAIAKPIPTSSMWSLLLIILSMLGLMHFARKKA